MIQIVVAFGSGVIFAVGLAVSGMTRPGKVKAFLDVFGDNWDPSLAFVLGGAVVVFFLADRIRRRTEHPLWAPRFCMPTRTQITRPLILGSALFGIGWGMSGFCPGPAVVSLNTFEPRALTFVLAMASGMIIRHWQVHKSSSQTPGQGPTP
jgi:uncharacterized membrane protein YedE/YeeE